MPRGLLLLSSALLLGACAGGTPAPPPAPTLQPVGTYDFTSEFQGQPISGSFEITQNETTGAFGGWMVTNVSPEVPVISVLVDGMAMTVECETPDGLVTFVLEFAGDAFTGTWAYLGDGGEMTGSKRAPQ